jgi:outer membrane protein OmpA-like peptidoglycan-associated protein
MVALRVLEPCDESWDAMPGTSRKRHCAACDRKVHDLTGLGEREAAGYVRLHGASLCVRMLVVGAAVAACGVPAQGTHVASAPPTPTQPVQAETGGTADRDNDGVDDAQDACPQEPGKPSADAKKNGCPELVVIESMGVNLVLQQIHFRHTDATLLRESFPLVDDVIAVLKENPGIARVEIGGHASSDEPAAQGLSEKRSGAVVRRMVSAGIDPKRLVVRAYGATKPIDDNKTETGRERNRRVEYRILEEAPEAHAESCTAPSPTRP